MADFTKAYNRTGRTEGKYSNDPADKGGETWEGISRNMHSEWEGWAIIDFYRHNPKFPIILTGIEKLELAVKKFYKKTFWDVMRGDEMTIQLVAESIYDSCVNMGPKEAIILAQRSLHTTETGKMDDATLNLLNNKA